MPRSARASKQRLRAAALRKRRSIPAAEMEALSQKVAANLERTREFERAALVVSYCATSDEVQTRPIIESLLAEGRRVAVVVTDKASKTLSFSEIKSFDDDLAPGAFGILEPKPGHGAPVALGDAQVVLVPVVAWDLEGDRLGHGAGYFDRALAAATNVTKIGLALESQRLPKVPESPHDVPLDVIVTEKRVVRPG